VIPRGLGKKLSVLTCSTCNNDVGGAKLDSHLHKKTEIDSFFGGFGGATTVDLHIGGHRLTAEWERSRKGAQIDNTLRIIEKATAPAALESSKAEFRALLDGSEIKLRFRVASERRANLSLLKAGYLLAFLRLGYDFIFSKNLDVVRQQIRSPSDQLLPLDALIVGVNELPVVNSVLLVTKPAELQGLLSVIELRPKSGPYTRGVLLPHPSSPPDFFEKAAMLKQLNGDLSIAGRPVQKWGN